MKTVYYRVADFDFGVCLPSEAEPARLLPSFEPFRRKGEDPADCLFRFRLQEDAEAGKKEPSGRLLEESLNDMGRIRLYAVAEGYEVSVQYADENTYWMWAAADFSRVWACIVLTDGWAGYVLSSMLRIAYSQAVLGRKAISLHASAVYADGGAYLFTGRSGTGKSTHAALWIRRFPACGLLNDDNPTVRVREGEVLVYGTPWSGKTPCYRNLSFPVRGIVRLNQAKVNRFFPCEDIEAFASLLPGCSVIRQDRNLYNCLCDTLVDMCGRIPVGKLDCLPDEEAAAVCRKAVDGRYRVMREMIR